MAALLAFDLFERKDFAQAVEKFSVAINIEPRQPSHFINRGVCYFALGLYRLSVMDMTQALSLQQQCPVALFKRACAFIELSELVDALGDLCRCLDIIASNQVEWADSQLRLDALNQRAFVLMRLGARNLALRDLDEVLECRPNDQRAKHNRHVVEQTTVTGDSGKIPKQLLRKLLLLESKATTSASSPTRFPGEPKQSIFSMESRLFPESMSISPINHLDDLEVCGSGKFIDIVPENSIPNAWGPASSPLRESLLP